MSYENISPDQFSEFRNKDNHVVLDVRTPGELPEGSIPGYTIINFFESNFITEIEKLDRSKTYLLYCRSGMRSGQACALMGKIGFKSLYNLQGGIGAWNAAMTTS